SATRRESMELIVARSVSGENPRGPHVTRITQPGVSLACEAKSCRRECVLAGGQLREILAATHPELSVIWLSAYPRDAVMEGDVLATTRFSCRNRWAWRRCCRRPPGSP